LVRLQRLGVVEQPPHRVAGTALWTIPPEIHRLIRQRGVARRDAAAESRRRYVEERCRLWLRQLVRTESGVHWWVWLIGHVKLGRRALRRSPGRAVRLAQSALFPHTTGRETVTEFSQVTQEVWLLRDVLVALAVLGSVVLVALLGVRWLLLNGTGILAFLCECLCVDRGDLLRQLCVSALLSLLVHLLMCLWRDGWRRNNAVQVRTDAERAGDAWKQLEMQEK
jgi:hypothetical protein